MDELRPFRWKNLVETKKSKTSTCFRFQTVEEPEFASSKNRVLLWFY